MRNKRKKLLNLVVLFNLIRLNQLNLVEIEKKTIESRWFDQLDSFNSSKSSWEWEKKEKTIEYVYFVQVDSFESSEISQKWEKKEKTIESGCFVQLESFNSTEFSCIVTKV